MGHRGEDVPAAQGDRGRRQPRQPSSETAPGNEGPRGGGSRGSRGDDGYRAADSGGYGYGPGGDHPGQGRQGYGPQDGRYRDPSARQPSGDYPPGQGQGGYGGPQAYQQNGRRYDQPEGYEQRHGKRGSGSMPTTAQPALPASPGPSGTGSPPVAETRQQARLDDSATWPGRAQGSGFQVTAARDGFDSQGGYDNDPQQFGADPGGDPYQDSFDGAGSRRDRRSGRGSRGRSARGPLGGKRLLFAAIGVVAVAVIGVAAYNFLLKPGSSSSNATATGSLPTSGVQPSQQACAKQLGTYCHIETAAGDPKPLTVAELYLPAFTNEMDKITYTLVSTKLDTTCSSAVIGQELINALQAGKCTQVVRASYVSGNGQIMGTIGVVNLSTTNEAHDAGKVVGQNNFIAPLMSKTGVASKLGNGTGVVEAEFKGHYLILTWSEYVNGTVPATKAQDSQLEQFSSDLVSGTANTALTQRMVTGTPASA